MAKPRIQPSSAGSISNQPATGVPCRASCSRSCWSSWRLQARITSNWMAIATGEQILGDKEFGGSSVAVAAARFELSECLPPESAQSIGHPRVDLAPATEQCPHRLVFEEAFSMEPGSSALNSSSLNTPLLRSRIEPHHIPAPILQRSQGNHALLVRARYQQWELKSVPRDRSDA